MCMVSPLDRLASASAVFLGQHGDITQRAQQRGVSRQRLYREADSVLRELHAQQHQQQLALLQGQVALLQARLEQLQAARRDAVVVGAGLQAPFAATAQAEGVSLPVARRLLAVLLPDRAPSVAALGRLTRQAGLRAGAVLRVFDEHARPRAEQGAAAEIFFGQKPVLMVVEPESQCWLSGRLSPSRDGEQWAKEFAQLPALLHLVRDGGKGLHSGVAQVNEQRRLAGQGPISEQLDHLDRKSTRLNSSHRL